MDIFPRTAIANGRDCRKPHVRKYARARGWISVPGTVLLLSCLCLATPARAQITVSPSAGISGEGQPAVGAAIGMSLGAVRPEVELGWARRGIDRRAATPSEPRGRFRPRRRRGYLPAVMADVSTLMFRVAVPFRRGKTFEPLVSVGAGLARATRQPPPGESLPRTDSQAGIEGGGGATIWLSPRIGLRTAATWLQSPRARRQFSWRPGNGPHLHERVA